MGLAFRVVTDTHPEWLTGSRARRIADTVTLRPVRRSGSRGGKPGMPVRGSIPTGRTFLQTKAKSRYSPSFISARAFTSAFKGLLEQGYVRRVRAGYLDRTTGKSEVGRYRATRKLISRLEDCGISVTWVSMRPNAEGIVLKDGSKNRVEYGEVPYANTARERLALINDRLARHWYDLDLPDDKVRAALTLEANDADEEDAYPFDLTRRGLHRVFNNSDWEQGGRFYGGWWQAVPKELRRFITIDGKSTVEVDYSGLHAAMLLAEAGLEVPDDPYARCFGDRSSDRIRSVVKRAFNALLNAKRTAELKQLDGFEPDLFGMGWREFKQHIIACFPELKTSFGTGIGLKLQRKDADLAEKVMLRFGELGYPCLPVHDSFLVHYALEDDLRDAMQIAFRDMFGRCVNMESESSKITYESTGWVTTSIDQILEGGGHEGRLREWYISKNLTANA